MSQVLNVFYQKVSERENYNGIIESRVIIVKKLNELKPGYIRVPKWVLIALAASIVFLTIILISACLILFNTKKPANYLDNCTGRSCFPNLGLKCIEGKCKCDKGKYFTNKCMDKKTNGAFCDYSYQCVRELECKNGKCQCKSGQYWNGVRCSMSKSYGEICTQSECTSSVYLTCDAANGICICPSTRFWIGSYCALKRNYGTCESGFYYSSSNCLVLPTTTITTTTLTTTTITTSTTIQTSLITTITTSTTNPSTTTMITITSTTMITTPTTSITSSTTSLSTSSSTTSSSSTISARCSEEATFFSNPSFYTGCRHGNLCLSQSCSNCQSNKCQSNGGSSGIQDCPC